MGSTGETIRERIRGTAIRLFAVAGFDGVSMRTIAKEANTSLRLVQHHFGDKEGLYRAVWEGNQARRTAERKAAIEQLDFNRPVAEICRDLIVILLRPLWMAASEPTASYFLRIMAYEAIDPRCDDRKLIEGYLDTDAENFLESFSRILPTVTRAEIVTCYLWMVTATLFCMLAGEPRSQRLGGLNGEAQFESFVDYSLAAWVKLAEARG